MHSLIVYLYVKYINCLTFLGPDEVYGKWDKYIQHEMKQLNKVGKGVFYKGFCLLLFNSTASLPAKLVSCHIHSGYCKTEKYFADGLQVRAASQVVRGYYVVIADRACYLFKLGDIVSKRELTYKRFPLPDDARHHTSFIKCCIAGNNLVVVECSDEKRVKIFHCDLHSVIENADQYQEADWNTVKIFKALKHPQQFKQMALEANFYCAWPKDFFEAGEHVSHN